jgi:ribosomal protein L11 methyltransferase
MAFGTGTHETTKLCLQAIEKYYDGGSFFDVGTGTGVLAMAAAKLSSTFQIPNSKTELLACDTDTDSVKIAEENAEINGVADKIKFYVGSIEENTPPFDFVAANLTADVIVPLLPLLTIKFDKRLILSGILREQQDWVMNEIERIGNPDFKFHVQTLGEWISILITNSR